MLVKTPEARAARPIDYAAGLLVRVLPRAAARRVDQGRRDLGVLLDAVQGRRQSPVATADRAVERAPNFDELDPVDLLPAPIGRRVSATRRDARVVYDSLVRGQRPSPVHVRAKAPEAAELVRIGGAPSPTVSRPMRILRVTRETADAISIYVAEPNGASLSFEAGQFLSFDIVVGGEKLRRAYSIAAPSEGPGSDAPHVTVKRVPDGRVSNYLNDHAKEGMHLEVFGPSGNFTLESLAPGDSPHLVLVAGGSGITPIISLAETALARFPGAKVTLVYGNRAEADVIFAERLRKLVATHEGRLVVDFVLAEPTSVWSDVEVTTGILNAETLGARLDALNVDPASAAGCYVCGPTPMMDAARDLLRGRGVPEARLHEERFSRPENRQAAEGSTEPEPMTIETAAGKRTVVVKPGQTLLEAGLGAALPMPFSCAMGGCGACAMVCVEGEVAMEEPNCLSEAERARGEVLTCVGYPTGPVSLRLPERN